MNYTLPACCVLLAAALPMSAEPSATTRLENSPRHHEWVTLESDGGPVDVFVAYPERADRSLAVVVIHENRGLTDWVRSVADQLAEAGYLALAPDHLTGKAPGGGRTADFPSSDDARNAIYALDAGDVIAQLNATADYAKTIPSANGRIAVAGFCWGGSQTWRLAMARDDLAAAFPFYGTAPGDATLFTTINCVVHGFYGEDDNRVNATIEPTAAAMRAAGQTFAPVIYDGAGHGFMRRGEEEPDSANARAMEEAWERWLDLLARAES